MVRIVNPSWLRENSSHPNVVTVDPRPVVKYLGGHIPRSVNIPLSKLLDPMTLELVPVESLYRIFGEAGIDSRMRVVLYDAYDGQNAAMLAWTLEYLGHQNVAILSSRLEGWIKDGGEVLYKPVILQPRKFESEPDQKVRASSKELLQRGTLRILDLRSGDEFQGKLATESRTGHIPGAISFPWTDLIGEGFEFLRSPPELEKIGSKIGLGPSDRIVTYCSYGPRAAMGYIALEQIGWKNVKVYDGSFHQWAKHPELPVEGEGLQLQF